MKTVTCKRIELSPDKWEKIWIIFQVSDGKKVKEQKIVLPRVERKVVTLKKRDEKTGLMKNVAEERDVNAFKNGHFTNGFTTKAAGVAVDTFYPNQKKEVMNFRSTVNCIYREAGRLKKNPLLLDVFIESIKGIVKDYVGMTDKRFDAWNLYCSTVDRVSLFGREGGDKEDDEALEEKE